MPRQPTAREWEYLNRTQPFSGIMTVKNNFGEAEEVDFDKANPVKED